MDERIEDQNKKKRLQRKPTAFERRVEARAVDQVTKSLEQNLEPAALTDPVTGSPEEPARVSGPKNAESPSSSVKEIATPLATVRNAGEEDSAKALSSLSSALQLLQSADLASDPRALRLLADLAELAQGGEPAPAARASHLIQPSGGGLPAPDLRREYERRLGTLRPGDVAGLMEVKREFRKRGLEIY
jgi:hypothetical protein